MGRHVPQGWPPCSLLHECTKLWGRLTSHHISHPQVRGLKEQLQKQLIEVQNSRTGVVVDQWLRVKGTEGGLGDLHLPGGGCA